MVVNGLRMAAVVMPRAKSGSKHTVDEIFNDYNNSQNQKSIDESIIMGQNEAEESNKIENDFVVERDECQFCRDVFGNYAHKNFVHNGCYIP